MHTQLTELLAKWKRDPLYATADFVQAAGELRAVLDGGLAQPGPSPILPLGELSPAAPGDQEAAAEEAKALEKSHPHKTAEHKSEKHVPSDTGVTTSRKVPNK